MVKDGLNVFQSKNNIYDFHSIQFQVPMDANVQGTLFYYLCCIFATKKKSIHGHLHPIQQITFNVKANDFQMSNFIPTELFVPIVIERNSKQKRKQP